MSYWITFRSLGKLGNQDQNWAEKKGVWNHGHWSDPMRKTNRPLLGTRGHKVGKWTQMTLLSQIGRLPFPFDWCHRKDVTATCFVCITSSFESLEQVLLIVWDDNMIYPTLFPDNVVNYIVLIFSVAPTMHSYSMSPIWLWCATIMSALGSVY